MPSRARASSVAMVFLAHFLPVGEASVQALRSPRAVAALAKGTTMNCGFGEFGDGVGQFDAEGLEGGDLPSNRRRRRCRRSASRRPRRRRTWHHRRPHRRGLRRAWRRCLPCRRRRRFPTGAVAGADDGVAGGPSSTPTVPSGRDETSWTRGWLLSPASPRVPRNSDSGMIAISTVSPARRRRCRLRSSRCGPDRRRTSFPHGALRR